MQADYQRHVRQVFESAKRAAETASAKRPDERSNDRNEGEQGQAVIVLRYASKRLLSPLEGITRITEDKAGVWIVGDFTRLSADVALHVKEAAVDAALTLLNREIDRADGRFFAPSWIE